MNAIFIMLPFVLVPFKWRLRGWVFSTVASQQEGSGFDPLGGKPGPFYVDFAYSSCVYVGFSRCSGFFPVPKRLLLFKLKTGFAYILYIFFECSLYKYWIGILNAILFSFHYWGPHIPMFGWLEPSIWIEQLNLNRMVCDTIMFEVTSASMDPSNECLTWE